MRATKGPRTAAAPLTDDYFIAIEGPRRPDPGANRRFVLEGWALSELDPHGRIDHILVYPDNLDDPASELGDAEYGLWREDATLPFGNDYGGAGFRFLGDTRDIGPGEHALHVLAVGKRGWNYGSKPLTVEAPGSVITDLVHTRQALAERDAEIARLQELVAGYERGRFMRFMRWLPRR